jgi:hypothetical protein
VFRNMMSVWQTPTATTRTRISSSRGSSSKTSLSANGRASPPAHCSLTFILHFTRFPAPDDPHVGGNELDRDTFLL